MTIHLILVGVLNCINWRLKDLGKTKVVSYMHWNLNVCQVEITLYFFCLGTGMANCKFVQELNAPGIIVQCDDGSFILQTRVVDDDIYERQNGEIYVWRIRIFDAFILIFFSADESC